MKQQFTNTIANTDTSAVLDAAKEEIVKNIPSQHTTYVGCAVRINNIPENEILANSTNVPLTGITITGPPFRSAEWYDHDQEEKFKITEYEQFCKHVKTHHWIMVKPFRIIDYTTGYQEAGAILTNQEREFRCHHCGEIQRFGTGYLGQLQRRVRWLKETGQLSIPKSADIEYQRYGFLCTKKCWPPAFESRRISLPIIGPEDPMLKALFQQYKTTCAMAHNASVLPRVWVVYPRDKCPIATMPSDDQFKLLEQELASTGKTARLWGASRMVRNPNKLTVAISVRQQKDKDFTLGWVQPGKVNLLNGTDQISNWYLIRGRSKPRKFKNPRRNRK